MASLCPDLDDTPKSRLKASWVANLANRFEAEYDLTLASLVHISGVRATIDRVYKDGIHPTMGASEIGSRWNLRMGGADSAHNATAVSVLEFVAASNGEWQHSRHGSIIRPFEEGFYDIDITNDGRYVIALSWPHIGMDMIGFSDTLQEAVRLCADHEADHTPSAPGF
jgi:hypothetical protein